MLHEESQSLPRDRRRRTDPNDVSEHQTESRSHALIAAAFSAFHRRTSRKRSQLSSRAFMTSGAWAFAGLTVLSFGGGLFLAVFSFNTKEHPITVSASHPPEMLYVKPTEAVVHSVAVTAAAAVAETPGKEAVIAPRTPSSDETRIAESRAVIASPPDDPASVLHAIASTNEVPLPNATANLAAAMRLGAVGLAQTSGRTGGDLTVSFSGEDLPSVPEPATGRTVALGLAGLVVLNCITRRRPGATS